MRSMHGGMDENERGYGTTIGKGTSEVYYGKEGHTKPGKEGGKTFRNRYQRQSRERYAERSGTQPRSYHKNEEEIINEKEAGKVESESGVAEKSELSNRNDGKGKSEVSKSNTMGGDNGGIAIEIYRKLKRLPSGSMFGMHMVDSLSERDQDRVILSLVVDKGSSKFSQTKEELARKWSWHSRELLIEMFNDEVMMAEAIFKATFLDNENANSDEKAVALANKLSLIGTKLGKK